VRTILDISVRRACRYICANRRMVRYVRRRPDDSTLRKRLEELAAERRRFGFRRLTVLLRREGIKDNVKRILRVYREANLQVRRRVKRRVALGRGTRYRPFQRSTSGGRSISCTTRCEPGARLEP
jgi:putative transposase